MAATLETFSREETEGGVVFNARSGAGTIEVTKNGISFSLRNMDGAEYVEMPDVLKVVLEDHRRLKNSPEQAKAVSRHDKPPTETKSD